MTPDMELIEEAHIGWWRIDILRKDGTWLAIARTLTKRLGEEAIDAVIAATARGDRWVEDLL